MKKTKQITTYSAIMFAYIAFYVQPALAFEDIFENAVDYLSGPLGFVLGALGLAFSALLYMFGGERHLTKVVSSGIGALLLMSAPKILSTIQGFVR